MRPANRLFVEDFNRVARAFGPMGAVPRGSRSTMVVPGKRDILRLASQPESFLHSHIEPKADGTWRLSTIILAVSLESGLPLAEIKSARRNNIVLRPRQVACWLAKRFTGASFPQIGMALGGRDHTTVLHACRQIDRVVTFYGQPERDHPTDWTAHLLSKDWKAVPR